MTVQAESSAEARRMVMEMFPGAVVTSVSQIKQSIKPRSKLGAVLTAFCFPQRRRTDGAQSLSRGAASV